MVISRARSRARWFSGPAAWLRRAAAPSRADGPADPIIDCVLLRFLAALEVRVQAAARILVRLRHELLAKGLRGVVGRGEWLESGIGFSEYAVAKSTRASLENSPNASCSCRATSLGSAPCCRLSARCSRIAWSRLLIAKRNADT